MGDRMKGLDGRVLCGLPANEKMNSGKQFEGRKQWSGVNCFSSYVNHLLPVGHLGDS